MVNVVPRRGLSVLCGLDSVEFDIDTAHGEVSIAGFATIRDDGGTHSFDYGYVDSSSYSLPGAGATFSLDRLNAAISSNELRSFLLYELAIACRVIANPARQEFKVQFISPCKLNGIKNIDLLLQNLTG